jgi:hypothetical protein
MASSRGRNFSHKPLNRFVQIDRLMHSTAFNRMPRAAMFGILRDDAPGTAGNIGLPPIPADTAGRHLCVRSVIAFLSQQNRYCSINDVKKARTMPGYSSLSNRHL